MEGFSRGEVLTRDRLRHWGEAVHAAGRTIAFTNGCFDLIHSGHLASLVQAAENADELVVAGRPLLPEADRAALIAALRPVSAVTIFAEPTPLETILQIRPDVLVKGSEYNEEDIVGAPEVKSWGGRVVRVPMVPGWSTSQIIEAVRQLP